MNGRELLFIIKARNAARGVINSFRKQLKGVGEAARKAQAALKGVAGTTAQVAAAARKAKAALTSLGNTRVGDKIAAQMAKARTSMLATIKSALNLRGLLAGFALIFVARASFQGLAEFGDQMARVKAISGATGEEFESLERKAREMGATTRFTAIQAAEGLAFFARAGFNAEESINAIKPALDLAAVGSLELGRSADILSNIMTTFGIATTDASKAADILAFTASNANTSIEQMGNAVKFVGPVASVLGISLNEVTAAIGALGNAGIQSTLAGTGLRIALLRLLDPSNEAKDAIKNLNLTLRDLDPSVVGFKGVVEALKGAQDQFSRGDFARAISQIFGARGAGAILSLVAQIDKFEELGKASKVAGGFVAKTAKEMEKNLKGATDIMISAISELNIALGASGLLPILSGIVKGITDVARAISSFVNLFALSKNAAEALTQFIRVLTQAIIVLSILLAGRLLLGLLKVKAAVVLLFGLIRRHPIGLLIVGFAAVASGAAAFGDAAVEAGKESAKSATLSAFLWRKVADTFNIARFAIAGLVLGFKELLFFDEEGFVRIFDATSKKILEFTQNVGESFDEFKDRIVKANNAIKDSNSDLTKNINRIREGLSAGEVEEFTKNLDDLRSAFAPNIEAMKKFADAEREIIRLLALDTEELKQLGTSRKVLETILAGFVRIRRDELNVLAASNRALKEEIKLIGLTGVAREIAEAKLAAQRSAEQTGQAIDPDDLLDQAALFRNRTQKEFLVNFKEGLRLREIEILLLGKSNEEIERISVALKEMEKAKDAGFGIDEIEAFGEAAVEAFDRATKANEDFQKETLNGVKRAFQDYIDEARNFADQFEDLTINAIRGVEDAFVEFVKTGKFNFKDLISSISADLLRLQVKGLLGDIFGALELGTDVSTPEGAAKEATRIMKEAGQNATNIIENTGVIVGDVILIAGRNAADALNEAADLIREAARKSLLTTRVPNVEEIDRVFGGTPLSSVAITPVDVNVEPIIESLRQTIFDENDDFTIPAFEPGGALDDQTRKSAIELGLRLQDMNQGYGQAGETGFDAFGTILNGLGTSMRQSSSQFSRQFGDALIGIVKAVTSGGSGGGGFGFLGDLFGGGGGLSSLAAADVASFDFFKKGGIADAQGAIKLHRFAEGGVARTPQLAMFGEGDKPEAFVPLPDGRRIPVSIEGSGKQTQIINVNMTVNTPDAASFGRNRSQIARQLGTQMQRTLRRDN